MLQLWQEMACQERVLEHQKRRECKDLESSNAHDCVASTSNDGDVLHSESAMVSKGKKWIYEVWLIDSRATNDLLERMVP